MLDIWVYESGRKLGNPNIVQVWTEGVVIPFRHKTRFGRRIVTAGGLNERFKPGAHTRDAHNYFVAPAAFAAACDKAKEYFRRNPPEKKGEQVPS